MESRRHSLVPWSESGTLTQAGKTTQPHALERRFVREERVSLACID